MSSGLKLTLPILVALFLGFFCGNALAPVSAQPESISSQPPQAEVKPEMKIKILQTDTIEYRYVEKPIHVVEYVERIKRVPVKLKHFENICKLNQWLYTISTSTVYLQTSESQIDCDDYASSLQQRAFTDGYILSLEVISAEEYNNVFKNGSLPANSIHAINLAIIGNGAYYIEPQTSEVVLAAHLD